MNDYSTGNKQEKTVGTERKLMSEITIKHENDYGIIRHLTTLGYDVETERIPTNTYDCNLHIKVFENVKYELSNGNPISSRQW
jgi:hypothetical protein